MLLTSSPDLRVHRFDGRLVPRASSPQRLRAQFLRLGARIAGAVWHTAAGPAVQLAIAARRGVDGTGNERRGLFCRRLGLGCGLSRSL